jgi:hypothetical protein
MRTYFEMGEADFRAGLPCQMRDKTASARDRRAWYAGWRDAAKLTAPVIPPEQKREILAELDATRKLLTEQAE